MLFNSSEFIFGFFPVTVLLFFWVARFSHKLAASWLTAASIFFYGWWNPAYVLLLVASVAFNYACGFSLARLVTTGNKHTAKMVLAIAVASDLALLGYYKYANFFLHTWDVLAGTNFNVENIILPLGISFFTFTQIAFLVDAYRGIAKEYSPIHYGLFVTYFPHLIAGPVLHHKEMMPQFQEKRTYHVNWEDVSVGVTIFFIGLFKKVVIADGIAVYATPLFEGAIRPDIFAAWGGALAYTFQLYFDFSGYSDMAIGLSRVIGVKLPLNFDSPYKAVNIIEFWRRWHMTLSRFLRDYLYFTLGGNRKGPVRRYLNLLITMLLGGLWHGAGWTFIAWGGLHGGYLMVNHFWRSVCTRLGQDVERSTRAGRTAARLLTFVAVVVGWVFFRADSFRDALTILSGMIGLNGVSLPAAIGMRLGRLGNMLQEWGVEFPLGGGSHFVLQYSWILVLLPMVWGSPNTQEILARYKPGLDYRCRALPGEPASSVMWHPTVGWAAIIALVTVAGLLSLTRVSAFLYYQF